MFENYRAVMGSSAKRVSDFQWTTIAKSTRILWGGHQACGHNFFNLSQNVLTNVHTRGYLKIKMSHDEIVGNVLSWLGSWLRDRKQPKPTLLITHSVCSQPSARRKYSSFLRGKVISGRPLKRYTIRFLLPCFERKILQFNLPPER